MFVSVPTAELTTFRAALTTAAGTVGHPTLADAFTKLAAPSHPTNNRFLSSTLWVKEWARRTGDTALRDAAQAVLNGAVGTPFLLAENASTLAHLVWQNGALVDTKGNAWTQNGIVPQTAGTPDGEGPPPSAGPFTTSNYYSLGTGSDALDVTTVSVSIVFAVDQFPVVPSQVLLIDGEFGVAGYYLDVSDTIQNVFTCVGNWVPSGARANTANAVVSGVNVGCGGVDSAGLLTVAKLNLGAIASAVMALPMVNPTAHVPKVGRYNDASSPATSLRVYEVLVSSATPSDATFAAQMNDVKQKLGITQW